MNKIFLIGNLTADPDYSVTSSGIPMCRFSIAVNRRFSGQNEEKNVDFFRIVTFRKTAENCASFLAKGRKVGVTGSIQINDYTDKEGNRRTGVEVLADEVEFLSPKVDGVSGMNDTPSSNRSNEPLVPINDDTLPF